MLQLQRSPSSALFPYTTLFRSRLVTVAPDLAARRFSCSTETGRTGVRPITRSAATPLTPLMAEACSRKSASRSEEHTSELQSRRDLVCRLLLEKKKNRSLNELN